MSKSKSKFSKESVHVEVGDDHGCVVHLLPLLLALISNLLCNQLTTCSWLFQPILTNDLPYIL